MLDNDGNNFWFCGFGFGGRMNYVGPLGQGIALAFAAATLTMMFQAIFAG